MPAADTFEQIVRRQGVPELVPFLVQLAKEDVVPVRQRVLALDKELNKYWEFKPGHWNSPITPDQRVMLYLAGLKTYSRKEALSRGFSLWQPTAEYREAYWTVLESAQPAWLTDWLLRRAELGTWQMHSYALLRELEARQLLAHHPRLLALALPELVQELGSELSKSGHIPADALATITARIQQDTTLLHRDLWLFFEFDTSASGAQAYVQLPMTPEFAQVHSTDTGRYSWQQWAELHPAQVVTWLDVLTTLTNAGHLNRGEVLTRSLLALRRDFRRPLLAWFKKLFLSLKPTTAELLARQAELVELLAHPLPLVVNFALDQLKPLWTETNFQLEGLLLQAEGLVMRADIAATLKTLLTNLGKLLKSQPAHAPAVARLYAAALPHADTAVQERAARGLAALMQAKKPGLAAAEQQAAITAIQEAAELLAAPARALLAPWLAAPTAAAPAAVYEPRSAFIPDLSPATLVGPVADWPELLFLTGQVLKHDDPLALERWLDGLLRLRADLPTDYPAQLMPYLVQARPFLQGKTGPEVVAILAGNGLVGHLGLVQALLISWAQGFTAARVKQVTLNERHASSDPLVTAEQRRLAFAETLLRERRALPLLSTPTHAPHWVAPTALLARLFAYEAAGQAPDPADLAVALARTAHAHPAEAVRALTQLPQLRHDGLRELLHWLLGPAAALPEAVTGRELWFGKLKEVVGQLLPPAAAPVTLAEALPQLWAVAARTKQPAAYPALDGLTLNECPNVGRPWQPHWELQPKSNTYVEQWKPGKPERTDRWTELHVWTGPQGGASPGSLLLYSLHAAYRLPHEKYHLWYQLTPLATDYAFLVALLPQYPAPLYWHTIRLAATRDAADAGCRDVLTQAMRSLLLPAAAVEAAASLLLAIGLTHHVPTVRALALEALLAAIATRRLVPAALGQALGQLLSADFVPLPRFTEQLAQARAIDATTDDALRQVLDVLLPALPAEPLRQTSKLLSFYADLRARYPQAAPMPAAGQARLREWQIVPSLKKLATVLLN